MSAPDRPNIVLLMTDQQKASAVGCYGNRHVPSPFQDRMAAKGIAFTQCFANSSVCTPSRASIMTGVNPLVHQCTAVQHRLPWNLPQFPELLSRHGYFNAAFGHCEGPRGLDRGYHRQKDGASVGALLNAKHTWMDAGRADVAWGYGPVDLPVEASHAALLTDEAIRALREAKHAEAPFFLQLSFDDPHQPYCAPRPFDTLVDPMAVDLPPRKPTAGRPAWQEKVARECGSHLASETDMRKAISHYYGMIAHANAQMQRLYNAMDELGQLDNTWFILTSDHGDFTGEKNLYAKCETTYECLLRVPLIVRPPDSVPMKRGMRVEHLTQLVDLMPTVLGLAGVDAPDYLQGYDLIEWIAHGATEPLRDTVFAQVGAYEGDLKTTWPGGMPESGRHPSLVQHARTHAIAYTRDPDYGDEAYDLRADPDELDNLLNPGKPAPPADLEDLRQRLDEFEDTCLALRDELNVSPGDRGYHEGARWLEAAQFAGR